jgi:hypothetical protein
VFQKNTLDQKAKRKFRREYTVSHSQEMGRCRVSSARMHVVQSLAGSRMWSEIRPVEA